MDSSKNSRVASAALIVMSSMVLSRLTGFIRETMLSWKVGLSWAQDAYIAAFAVPDLIYTLLVGGTISAALVPLLSSYLEKGREEEGWKATSAFINVIFFAMAILCAIGVIFAPYIVPAVAPGFANKSLETKELAITLTRILFPSVSFIMLAGICNGVLNTYKKFAAAAYGPSIYNLGSALSIFLFADTTRTSMEKVAAGVAVSALIYFLFQLSFALKDMKYYRFIIDFGNKGFRMLVKQAVPSLLSSSIVQVNVLISIMFISLSASAGSISAFRNANTAWQLPYGIFAMGIGTAVLPTLSRKFASRDLDDYKNLLIKSLNSVLFLSMPSAVGFILLREPIVRAIFKWGGRFTESNVPIVAGILGIFSVAMITQSIVAMMNRAFYAAHDTRTPLFVGMGSTILNLCFGYLFYKTTNLGAAGMAISYSVISTVNSILLLILLNKKMKGIYLDRLFAFLIRALPASVFMGGALFLLEQLPFHPTTKLMQLAFLVVEIAAGVGIYFGLMLLFKSEQAVYFLKAFLARVRGNRKSGEAKRLENPY